MTKTMNDDIFTIRLFIIDKYYPLRIKRSEEEIARKAAKMVNDRIDYFKSHFDSEKISLNIKDILSMAACQIAFESLKSGNESTDTEIVGRIKELNKELDFIKN